MEGRGAPSLVLALLQLLSEMQGAVQRGERAMDEEEAAKKMRRRNAGLKAVKRRDRRSESGDYGRVNPPARQERRCQSLLKTKLLPVVWVDLDLEVMAAIEHY
jgi:hypothetical protein